MSIGTMRMTMIIIIITLTTVAVMTLCEKFTEKGRRGNCTDARIDSLNDCHKMLSNPHRARLHVSKIKNCKINPEKSDVIIQM